MKDILTRYEEQFLVAKKAYQNAEGDTQERMWATERELGTCYDLPRNVLDEIIHAAAACADRENARTLFHLVQSQYKDSIDITYGQSRAGHTNVETYNVSRDGRKFRIQRVRSAEEGTGYLFDGHWKDGRYPNYLDLRETLEAFFQGMLA